MPINLLYSNEIEGKAVSAVLEKQGYRISRSKINFKTIDHSNTQSLFIVDTEYLQESRKKQLDILCNPKNYIVLVGHLSHLHWFFKINCSLSCFISKEENIATLSSGIKKITTNKPFFSDQILSFLKKKREQQHKILLQQNISSYLTITELQTMSQIAAGKTTRQIAECWNRSHHTINNHRKNILKKLGINGTFGLTKFCFQKKNEIQTLISLRKNKESIRRIRKNNER